MWDVKAIEKLGYSMVSSNCKLYSSDHCGKAGEKRVRICCANCVLCVDCVRKSFNGISFYVCGIDCFFFEKKTTFYR